MIHCSHKGTDMVSNNTLACCSVWLMPGCEDPENICHTLISTSMDLWDKAGLIHALYLIYGKYRSYHSKVTDSSQLATFSLTFLLIVQFWWACANCSLSFYGLQPVCPFFSEPWYEECILIGVWIWSHFRQSTCLNALSCCHVIIWLVICVNKHLKKCT